MKLQNLMALRAMEPRLAESGAVARFVRVLDAVDSTDREARRLLADESFVRSLAYDGDSCGELGTITDPRQLDDATITANSGHGIGAVVADFELEPHGRFGRRWVSIPGQSLSMTLVTLVPTALVDDAALRGWLAPVGCLALIDAIRGVVGASGAASADGLRGLTLKWPNDIYLNGLRLGSVNVDAVPVDGVPGHTAIVYSFGANLTVRADYLPTPQATSLRMHVGKLPAFERLRDEIVAETMRALNVRLIELSAEPSFARVRFHDEAQRLCPMRGRVVTFQLDDGSRLGGRIVALNDDASITMETSDGPHVLRTVDVGIMA
ncbi:biotin--[acetyl-CoA-carboxylase] ligase [Bifidobacterium choloepi]|uniref:BPL/LPL catalytic domain-containing protein n=1 Tax=Bifidobacterium choloepi TaxID=2614131 RepID=A0A6I5MZR1_9BIFI|nr:hypothetical protein [Bifidobacterium choloepi]NEG69716.1 hypothetical protein [Bifidobacterium choloepi]